MRSARKVEKCDWKVVHGMSGRYLKRTIWVIGNEDVIVEATCVEAWLLLSVCLALLWRIASIDGS